MANQVLGLGGNANDGTGDTLRAAADKINDNFLEIYTLIGDTSSLSSGISATASVVTLTAPTITGVVGGTQTSATITTLATTTVNGTTLNGGTLALAAGSITDSSGAISFGNENLTTTGTITGLLATAAQTNVTSLGTLTALQIDNLNLNGNTLSTTAGTDLNITPVSGQQIVLDGAIIIDAGVVTGATSITSTAFVGDITGDVTGNADTATTLATARTIGGTSFNGSANIAVALSATATALATARTIGGTSFDGSANIAVALASVGTAVTVADESSDTTCFPLFTTAATGDLPPKSGTNLTFNSSSGLLTATLFAGALTGNVTGNASGTAATVTGAAQTAITSVGTLTALQIDNLNLNGNTLSSTAGTDLLITPLGGQQIVLDGAIIIDAGVVTGATSITSTAFVGALTGNVTGNASGTAATVTGAAQTNITSVGTLTALQIDNLNLNGNTLSSTAGTDLLITPLSGQQIVLDGAIIIDAGVVTGATSVTSTAFVGDITGDVTGTADIATAVTVADESSDTTCFPLFATAATGDLPPKSGTNLTFNSSSGLLTATGLAAATVGASGLSSLDGGINTNDDFTVDADGNVVGVAATFSGLTNLTGSFSQAIHTFVATDAITSAEHAGRVLLLGEVGGNADVVLTLPDATGTGHVYKFIVTVTMASNTYKIQCPDADNVINGTIKNMDLDGTAQTIFGTASTSDTITLNGGTQGGQVSDTLTLIDIAANLWHVEGQMRTPTGANPATPFSAAVS